MTTPGPLTCCLNGGRSMRDHPRCPTTPEELARDAALVVAAGATELHVHPRDAAGGETFDAVHVGEALTAMRAVTDVPVGVTTGAWILPDPADRLRAIEAWQVLPDVASVNLHEPGADEVARLLLARGVDVEAGVWHEEAAAALAAGGLAERCVRILVEPMEQALPDALAHVTRIEDRLAGVATDVPRLLHGSDLTTWALLDEAAERGWETRIGLEDTLVRPDGRPAQDNSELVRIAAGRAS